MSNRASTGSDEKEARIRALTREAGSLREELRREEKRRERAIAQVVYQCRLAWRSSLAHDLPPVVRLG